MLAVFVFAASVQAGNVSGDLTKWAPVTVDFDGPGANESDKSPNPFLDYRLNVTFTSPSGNTYLVPGFFAGDGQGGGSGNHWQVRFAADEVGQWRYRASMKSGQNVAVNLSQGAGNDVKLSNPNGEFYIQPQSANAPGFLRYGRLEYTGEHYLKFRDGPYWIKSGTDSPENFLGYVGIDGTVDQSSDKFLHDYRTHRGDARDDDPVFTNANNGQDSRGITGALNYLAEQGVNSIYFLPMNLGGDGQETFPFVGGTNNSFNKTHYDVSKLYQWNMVLNHAQRRGIALNIVLAETERANERWFDNGQLGTERKLFYRELVARFGYLLAAKWNLGEENDFPVSELRLQADYLKQLDWTKKPIAVHTQINNFRDYEKLVGDELFSATSIQYDPPLADQFVETWRERSSDAGRKWVIDMDENTGGVSRNNANIRRKQITYDVYFSGGNLEWYYGYHPLPLGGDITGGDFRQREATWRTMRYARQFMQAQLPFWRMQPADELVSGEANSYGGAEVFAATNEIYAAYFPNASGNATLDLSNASGSFSQRWFNPRNGQFEGGTKNIVGGQRVAIGSPPAASNEDWVVLIKSHNAPAVYGQATDQETDANGNQNAIDEPAPPKNDSPGNEINSDNNEVSVPTTPGNNARPTLVVIGDLPAAVPGTTYKFSLVASDAEGIAPVVTAKTLPPGMQFRTIVDGAVNIEWRVPDDATDSVSFEIIAIDVQDRSVQVVLPISIAIAGGTDASTTSTQNPTATNANTTGNDQPPTILGVTDSSVETGRTIRLTITPRDPEGIVPSLRLQFQPKGSRFEDNGNGTRDFVWTPSADDVGEYQLRFIATDAGKTAHVVQETMRLTVIKANQ